MSAYIRIGKMVANSPFGLFGRVLSVILGQSLGISTQSLPRHITCRRVCTAGLGAITSFVPQPRRRDRKSIVPDRLFQSSDDSIGRHVSC
jgi:hypothetical protein